MMSEVTHGQARHAYIPLIFFVLLQQSFQAAINLQTPPKKAYFMPKICLNHGELGKQPVEPP